MRFCYFRHKTFSKALKSLTKNCVASFSGANLNEYIQTLIDKLTVALYRLQCFCGSQTIPYPGLNSSSAVGEDEVYLFRHIPTVQHPPKKLGLEPHRVKDC